jgi:carboxylate-amine ligase
VSEGADPMSFKVSAPQTVGVELELQIVNTRDYNLTRGAPDLLQRLGEMLKGQAKPEITESMIELNSSVHARYDTLLTELRQQRDALAQAAEKLNVAISGGGSHPFHRWSEQRIFPTERFKYVSALYGYLAKQFTVFGQHVHLGCESGDQALYLLHRLARYVPHFIALASSSPFHQGVDTQFECSRLNAISAFPNSGHAPFLLQWSEFRAFFEEMVSYGIAASMKDFYWDIRPKPEYGTVEIRVCDTPLDVELAAALGAYAQALTQDLIATPVEPASSVYLVYAYNRFQACRFGLEGKLVDPATRQHVSLAEDILATLERLEPQAQALGSAPALRSLKERVINKETGSSWLRQALLRGGALADVVRLASDRWMARKPPAAAVAG